METYIKEFMTKLDPAVASKYGEYIQWRICALNTAGPEDRTLSWEELKKLKAGENRDYSTWTEFLKGYQRNGEEYACWSNKKKKATESITDTLVCLDAATGKLLWKKDFPATKVSVGWGLSPSGTPAVWNGKCYFVGIMGIYCLSAKDGTLLWQSKEGGNSHASVLVANGVVVGGWPLAAYDAESGKKLWYTGNYRAGGTPILWSTGGKNYIIAAGSWGVTLCCIDMATWKVVWDFKTGNSGQSTPVIVGDTLVFSADVGTCAYKITPEKAEFLWKSPVNDGIESFVVYQDHIYMDISNHRAPEWYCLSLKTGETKWHLRNPSSRGNIVSSPILADGKIMIPTTSEGTHAGYTLQMFKPSPEKFISLGKFNPEGAQCSSPAFVGGKLYLRVWDGIACYDLTAK